MTPQRQFGVFFVATFTVGAALTAFDGLRGLKAACAAAAVCAVPVLRWARPARVADAATDPRITALRRTTTHLRRMGFRMGWCLTAGLAVYLAAGELLGAGFWIALLVLYQVGVVLGVVSAAPHRTTAAPPPAG